MALVEIWTNNAITTVAVGGLSASATTINLAPGTGVLFPSPIVGSQFFRISLTDAATGSHHEIVNCTGRSLDTLTIVRAQEGTIAQNWIAGDLIENIVTAATLVGLQLTNTLGNYANDTAAAAGGVLIGGNYRNGSVLMVRVA